MLYSPMSRPDVAPSSLDECGFMVDLTMGVKRPERDTDNSPPRAYVT